MRKMTMMCMAALLLMAVSCKKEKANEEYTGEGFRATTESHTGDGDSKTQLLDNLSVTWCDGDIIKVFSSTDSDGKKFSAANAGTTADLNPVDAVTDAFFTPSYTAFYPYDPETGINQISLKGTQHYTMTDGVLTFASGENPMAAKSNSKVLPFKNLCGILKFQLYSASSCTVKSLRVTSLKSGEQLWGTGTVTFDGTNATLGTLTGGSESITLDCGEGVDLSTSEGTPTEFMFVIPGGALSEGFTVTLTDADNKVWSKTTTASNTITKSKIKAMPKLPVGTHEPVVPVVTIADNCLDCTYTIGGTVEIPDGETCMCEYGLVYSLSNSTPTIGGNECHKLAVATENITGSKDFAADITGVPDGRYYVRAYAIAYAESYSSDGTVKYVWLEQPKSINWENGMSPLSFTVGMDGSKPRKVYFSQGNLQYLAKGGAAGDAIATAVSGASVGGTWRFAEHQFDFIGADNKNASQTYDRWIDKFGWGTSGINHGAIAYQPWSTSETKTDYNAYDNPSCNLNSQAPATADWGYNAISNSDNAVNSGWRTLTGADEGEWAYLLSRTDGSGNLLYGEGKVGNCTKGLIILPDDWSLPSGLTFTPGLLGWQNVYSYSEWAQMEAAGAVFLPAARHRTGNSTIGYYWSSTSNSSGESAFNLFFRDSSVNGISNNGRTDGFSVRLVKNVTIE